MNMKRTMMIAALAAILGGPRPVAAQRFCVLFGNFKEDESYEQFAEYHGTIIISVSWMPLFDESKEKLRGEKIFNRDDQFDSKTFHIVGL